MKKVDLSSEQTREAKFSVANVTRFYIPLLLQGFSQSLSYLLVGGIVAHGAFGPNGLTAMNQGLLVMFIIGALGGGLLTTGLVFAKTWYGYVTFRRLNVLMSIVLLALQVLTVMPPFDRWIFEGIFNQPHELAIVSSRILTWGLLLNLGFFLRNPTMVVLFNFLESGKANNATLVRILLTLGFAAVFPKIGLVGPDWGLFAMTIGVWVETIITWIYARPYVRRLPNRPAEGEAAVNRLSPREMTKLLVEQFKFTMPLSLGGFLLMCSPLIIAAFVARSADAAAMLVIHYATTNSRDPFCFGALRFQTVAVKFMPEYKGDRRLLWYGIVAGAILGLFPLLFSTPLFGDWLFGSFQNVPNDSLPTARLAMAIYSLLCVIMTIRARIEGVAAEMKRPGAVMFGQIAYTVTLFVVCATLLPLGCPGWAMAVVSIFVAQLYVIAVIYASLIRAKVSIGSGIISR